MLTLIALAVLIAAAFGALVFFVMAVGMTAAFARLFFGSRTAPPATESLKETERLFIDLRSASTQMDSVVRDIERFTENRHATISQLEQELDNLSRQEQELKERVEGLKNVPLPAAEYFAQLVDKGERKSAWRDYILFLLGVIVSGATAILLRWLGWA